MVAEHRWADKRKDPESGELFCHKAVKYIDCL